MTEWDKCLKPGFSIDKRIVRVTQNENEDNEVVIYTIIGPNPNPDRSSRNNKY